MSDIDDFLESPEKTNKKKDVESEYKPGVGVDVGTSNIVVARQKKDGTFVNKFHRNMLYPLEANDESADLLERSDYVYVKVGETYYIVGEDALKLVNALGRGEIIRPMKDGILNPNLAESSELLFYIIKAVVGKPLIENEPLRFSVPANPVDRNLDNRFHQMLLNNFFKKIKYDPKPINEAMCVAYDCKPVMKTDEGDVSFSGLALSAGAGMSNVALTFKGLELDSFSLTKSGDYIDDQVSITTGVQSGKVIKMKEKKLDLNKLDMSDRALSALYIYYEEVIDRLAHTISNEFKNRNSEMEGEIEIVVAGGTSMPNGYCEKFEEIVKSKSDFPFDVYQVRHSENPFYSVSQGACIRAQADYLKNNK